MPANFVVYFRPLSCTNLEFPDNLGQLSRFARDVRTRIYILRRGSKKGHIQIWKYPRINDLVYFGKFRSPIGDSKKKKNVRMTQHRSLRPKRSIATYEYFLCSMFFSVSTAFRRIPVESVVSRTKRARIGSSVCRQEERTHRGKGRSGRTQ